MPLEFIKSRQKNCCAHLINFATIFQCRWAPSTLRHPVHQNVEERKRRETNTFLDRPNIPNDRPPKDQEDGSKIRDASAEPTFPWILVRVDSTLDQSPLADKRDASLEGLHGALNTSLVSRAVVSRPGKSRIPGLLSPGPAGTSVAVALIGRRYRRNLKSSGHETKQAAGEQVCALPRGILIIHSTDDGTPCFAPSSPSTRQRHGRARPTKIIDRRGCPLSCPPLIYDAPRSHLNSLSRNQCKR